MYTLIMIVKMVRKAVKIRFNELYRYVILVHWEDDFYWYDAKSYGDVLSWAAAFPSDSSATIYYQGKVVAGRDGYNV